MNVSIMPSAPQLPISKIGILGSEKPVKDIGANVRPENFNDFLADSGKKGASIDSSFLKLASLETKAQPIEVSFQKGINFEKNILKNEVSDLKNIKHADKIPDKELDELVRKFDPLNKLESNELFLFQRELANKMNGKNDALHSFSKVFNVEKKDEKPKETVSGGENIGNLVNNNKELEGLIRGNKTEEGSLKFNSPKELFNWISKVISKNQIKSGETLHLQVRDNSLGAFNISAQNGSKGGEINMSIVSQTKESDEFFKTNEKDLIKSLENAGVKVGKIEILTAESAKASANNNDNMSDNKNSLSELVSNQFSQKEQLERDSQRRKEIWSRFRDLREA